MVHFFIKKMTDPDVMAEIVTGITKETEIETMIAEIGAIVITRIIVIEGSASTENPIQAQEVQGVPMIASEGDMMTIADTEIPIALLRKEDTIARTLADMIE